MFTTLFTGASGMDAMGKGLSVVGDNIANMNTVGFKSSKIAFSDILGSAVSGGAGQIGRGVMVSDVHRNYSQGTFETSSNYLDLAVDGEGFFVVGDKNGKLFTRAGQFKLDREGKIVNAKGFVLQGYRSDDNGNITQDVGDLIIAPKQKEARATSKVTFGLNLDSREKPPVNTVFNPQDTKTYNYSSQFVVYDSQGDAHQITGYYVKNPGAANTWTANYVYKDPVLGTMVTAGTQQIRFGQKGELLNDNSNLPIAFNFGPNVNPSSISFDYGEGVEEGSKTGFLGTVQLAADYAVHELYQDGFTTGSLTSLNINKEGKISALFGNGQTRILGQVVLAKFAAPTELARTGDNLLGATFDSGDPIIAGAASNNLGRVLSNTLELSNVDLSEEFIKMIAFQRAFQANTRTITTTDEMLQELLTIKR